MEVVLVAHTRAREVRHALPQLTAAFAAHGVALAAVHAVASSRALRRAVRGAAKGGATTVAVAGGDGAMTHAVGALAHRDTVLGVIPLGTGNSFARSLGLPLGDVAAAVAVIAAGRIERVDLGRAGETYFANFATIGLSSSIAAATAGPLKEMFGRIAYGVAALRPLLTQRAFSADVKYDGGNLKLRTLDLIVANGRYFGATPVAPDASLTDGKLTLYAVGERTAFDAVRTYVTFGLGGGLQLPDAHVVRTAALRVRTKSRQPVAVDGSLLGRTPLTFSVAPRALRVHVGAGFDGER